MTSLLLLLACTGFSATSTPVSAKDRDPEPMATRPSVTPAVVLPTTPLVQQECFASANEYRRYRSGAVPPPSPVGSAAAPKAAPVTAAPSSAAAPAAAPAPAPVMASTGASASSGAIAPNSVTEGAALGRGAAAGDALAGGAAPRQSPAADKATESKSAPAKPKESPKESAKASAKKDMPARAEMEEMQTSPDANDEWVPEDESADWGATVYLSNDDSMSLASAQRLLWAIQNHGPVKTSEIRPHELLNYFSFDTAEVKPGQVYSALGAAAQTAPDTLTMSFAVKGYTPARKPLDLTLVLDRSGSMAAEGRMDYLRRGLLKMTESLQPGDRMDLVLFDNELCSPLQNFVVGRDDMSLLTSAISKIQPRGSTNLGIGLREGYALATGRDVHAPGEAGRNKRMMLITDALMNEGQIDPNILSEIGRGYEQAGVNLTAVGVGTDFNDKVLDQLSEKGHGAYVYLGSEAVVDRVFGVGLDALTRTIARDVHFSVDLPPSLAMERFYGEEASTNKEDVQPINYFSGTSQLFLQDLKIRGGHVVPSDPIVLNVEWVDPDTGAAETQSFHTTVGTLMASDARNLQKGRALMAWSDLLMTRSLGGDVCGQPMTTWRERVTALGQDAEISWLDSLTSPLCGQAPVPVAPMPRTVALKIKLDSDLPIAEVGLSCGSWHGSDSLGSGESVARFDARPGSCTLTLQGTVPMTTQVQVPETGADLRCVVRAGRLACN
jgi:Ca-activated chloride channel family protein